MVDIDVVVAVSFSLVQNRRSLEGGLLLFLLVCGLEVLNELGPSLNAAPATTITTSIVLMVRAIG